MPCIMGVGFAYAGNAHATAKYSDVPVSDGSADNSLSGANTGRKIAVAPNGYVYAVYHGATQGIRFTRSGDRGQNFEPSIQLDTPNSDVEIAVDNDGVIYVAWMKSGTVRLARSFNEGLSFGATIDVGDITSTSVHMAVANPYVYIIEKEGTTLFINGSRGVGGFTTTTIDTTRVYSDVHVDPLTNYVYVQTDDPNVLYFKSTNHGQSFSPSVQPGVNIYYSTSAFANGSNGTYLYVAGGQNSGIYSDAVRINLNNDSFINIPVSHNEGTTQRSLAADDLGNIVSGFYNAGVLRFETSTNYGETFPEVTTVATGSFMSLAIDPLRKTVLALYEKDGKIFLSTYSNLLTSGPTPVSSGGGGIDVRMFTEPKRENISVTINQGQTDTTSDNVTLDIKTGNDIASMSISNSADFKGISIQPLAASLPWKICDNCQSGQTYTVYVKLFTAFGQSTIIPASIRYENQVVVNSPALKESKPAIEKITPKNPAFKIDLKVGSQHPDVARLQRYLNSRGFIIASKGAGSPGKEVSYFGLATKKALMKFQLAHAADILTPSGLKTASGVFATSTRAYINAHP